MKLVGVDVGGTFTDLVLFDTASPTVLSLFPKASLRPALAQEVVKRHAKGI